MIPPASGDCPISPCLTWQATHFLAIKNSFLGLYLSGDIPSLYAKPMYKNSFVGNSGLCGDFEGLCDERDERKNTGYAWLLRSIFVLSGLIMSLEWVVRSGEVYKVVLKMEKNLKLADESNAIEKGSS
nr:receptor-like protein kinase HSL1 [Ipomoea batatas]